MRSSMTISPSKAPKDAPLNLRVSAELKAEFQRFCEEYDVSQTFVARIMLEAIVTRAIEIPTLVRWAKENNIGD